ncbi:MAG: SAM-dependent methyltransferase [Clostridia bacterium]|nr:SAM-dependent methyltransferase [Clostridia bacterium]
MQKFEKEIQNKDNFKYIFSSPLNKNDAKKIIYRKIEANTIYWQEEKFIENKVIHKNFNEDEISITLINSMQNFKQCCIQNENATINAFNNNGKIAFKKVLRTNKCNLSHNKEKSYFINEGDNVPFLVELGIFNNQNKIITAKYDKFKQINRFIEIIDDNLKKYNKKEINIIDFGCGKSYLTFVLYYYFTNIKNITAFISGYDLKADVVENCNKLAQKYSYTNLKFYNEDVANVKITNPVDMLITLHACDIATDYALNFAINNNIKYIFSVPCCQHEINLSIKKGGDFDCLLDYGLIKERFSALLTDTVRANILECKGYKVDILEFVDFSHTPKNIMIRAEKTTKAKEITKDIYTLKEKYNFNQKLLQLQTI